VLQEERERETELRPSLERPGLNGVVCGPRRGTLRERERETEYKTAPEGSSLRSGWEEEDEGLQ
jgi:hypothetical protein